MEGTTVKATQDQEKVLKRGQISCMTPFQHQLGKPQCLKGGKRIKRKENNAWNRGNIGGRRKPGTMVEKREHW